MLKIRLQRVGRKHEPVFRVVLTDSQNSTKSGRYLEVLGSYDPRHKDLAHFETEKIQNWISKGVQLTDTLHNMFIDKKIIQGKKINALPRKTPQKKEGEGQAEQAPVEKAEKTEQKSEKSQKKQK
jgi:small subunit ribosomal protein S16